MSWNVYTTSQTAATIEDTAREAFAAHQSAIDDDEQRSVNAEQFEAGLHAAQSILASGAVGDGPAHVTLSGHANQGHRPRDGWANDTITVSVSQA